MKQAVIKKIYTELRSACGPRGWWPGEGRDEIIIGAVLTQNTAWRNVVKALASLKEANLCRLASLAAKEPEEIAPLIRSSGYFNLKSRRLRSVAEFFAPAGRERFDELDSIPTDELRERMLGVWGMGPETVDSILLYALDRLTFVVDAYTLRVAERHGLSGAKPKYHPVKDMFTRHVPSDLHTFNEYHALLVWVGHHYCKPKPRCHECPLAGREFFTTERAWRELHGARKQKGVA